MNERIDVLAQLRTTYCPPECLAAVAELVEAAKEIERMVEVRAGSSIDRGRLIAAIAGVRGNHE